MTKNLFAQQRHPLRSVKSQNSRWQTTPPLKISAIPSLLLLANTQKSYRLLRGDKSFRWKKPEAESDKLKSKWTANIRSALCDPGVLPFYFS